MNEEFIVKFGETIENPYELPIASEDTLGGVKVGYGLNVDSEGYLNNDLIHVFTAVMAVGTQRLEVPLEEGNLLLNFTAWQANKMIQVNLEHDLNSNTLIFTTENEVVENPINFIIFCIKTKENL